MHDYFMANGARYVSHDSLVFGDYGGAGSVGRANIDALCEDFGDDVAEASFSDWRGARISGEPDVLETYAGECPVEGRPALIVLFGAHHSEQAFIREDLSRDIIASLENYPLLDEQKHSEIEMQWESEAWESWLRSDLLGACSEDTIERFDAMGEPDALAWECYRDAMESTNTYPETEYSGTYIPHFDRVAEVFAENLGGRLAHWERYGDTSTNGELDLRRPY